MHGAGGRQQQGRLVVRKGLEEKPRTRCDEGCGLFLAHHSRVDERDNPTPLVQQGRPAGQYVLQPVRLHSVADENRVPIVGLEHQKGLFAVEGVGVVGASLPGSGSRSLEDEGSYTPHPKDLDVPNATGRAGFACADLTTFCRLDGLGLEVTGQQLHPDRAILACRVADDDSWCRRCGEQGVSRDSVTRELAHEPFGWRPTTLLVTLHRYRCAGCAHVWRQDLGNAAEPRTKLSRRALQWALKAIVCQHLTVARVAEALAVSWNTANNAVLAEGQRVLIADPARFDGVRVIGVDEHVWRHTRRGDKYVTVIIDLTAVHDQTGPARLLDMVEGRSKKAFADWLAQRPQDWRDQVEVVAMDGFSGFKAATAEELPEAATVMDPFHVVRLAGKLSTTAAASKIRV